MTYYSEVDKKQKKTEIPLIKKYTGNTASLVVQRAVGFEFQTVGGNWNVAYKTNKKEHPFTRTSYHPLITPGSGNQILNESLDDITIKNDGSDLEFVTKPIDERDISAVTTLARKVSTIYNHFIGLKPSYTKPFMRNEVGTNFSSLNVLEFDNAFVNKNGEATAHPQATAGVKKEKLLDFLNRASDIQAGGKHIHSIAKSGSLYEASYGHSTYSENVVTNNPQIQDSPKARSQQKVLMDAVADTAGLSENDYSKEAKGIISFLMMCIHGNQEVDAKASSQRDMYAPSEKAFANYYAKNKMPVMPRTTLLDLFKVLEPLAQQQVLTYFSNHPELANEKVAYQKQGTTERRVLLSDIIRDFTAADSKDSLFGGKGFSFNGIGSAHRLNYGSGENRTTNIGYDTDNSKMEGMNVELRALPNKVPADRWGEVVEIVSHMMQEINM